MGRWAAVGLAKLSRRSDVNTAAWVIGAHGLLGRALTREVTRRPSWELVAAESLPWGDASGLELAAAARRCARKVIQAAAAPAPAFAAPPAPPSPDAPPPLMPSARTQADVPSQFAPTAPARWAVLWAAGVAVTSGSPEDFERELSQLTLILDAVAREVEAAPGSAARGVLFYSSSAGGVYAGARHPPFTERTPVAPIAPYGHFKLDAEAAVDAFSTRTGVSVVKGRIANLYGPGQRLDKTQGLISQLAKAEVTHAPMPIYMPLDTMRDYIFSHDCAGLILDSVERCAQVAAARPGGARDAGDEDDPGDAGAAGEAARPIQVVKNMVSHRSTTIGVLLGLFRTIGKKRANVTLGASRLAALQAVDLRVDSVVWPDLDEREETPLAAGVKATLDDILLAVQEARRG